MMDSIIGGVVWVRHPVLLLHIVSGYIGMYGGIVPLFTKKGGSSHRRWGRVFVWGMGIASITSFPLAFWHEDIFQAAIGLLTGYLTIMAVRSLRHGDERHHYLDWILALGSSLVFLVMTGTGIAQLATVPSPEARAAIVFGLLGLLVSGRSLHALTLSIRTLRQRVLDHILASCLALICAFASFFNTQLYRFTGLEWPLDWRMLIPVVCAAPFFVYHLPRWSQRLHGVRRVAEINQPEERSESARLRLFALAEGISFLVLLGVAVPLKHFGGYPEMVRLMGPIHGTLFVLYVIAVIMARRPLRWSISRVAAALVAGIVPGGVFVFDAILRREEQRAEKDELSGWPKDEVAVNVGPRRSSTDREQVAN
ncbi:DUF3817 domain-containing protein [Pararhizobium sp. PWRC1-1]|uniref:DUF3817 domain-containing protein n=1 Tax=Pararhizobium sp. PWRC1-1 TaxID=2804566 RepID=UPI003CFBC2B9